MKPASHATASGRSSVSGTTSAPLTTAEAKPAELRCDPSPRRPTVAFAHLGCEKNRVDTEHMLGLLAQAGYGVSADEADANVEIGRAHV